MIAIIDDGSCAPKLNISEIEINNSNVESFKEFAFNTRYYEKTVKITINTLHRFLNEASMLYLQDKEDK